MHSKIYLIFLGGFLCLLAFLGEVANRTRLTRVDFQKCHLAGLGILKQHLSLRQTGLTTGDNLKKLTPYCAILSRKLILLAPDLLFSDNYSSRTYNANNKTNSTKNKN